MNIYEMYGRQAEQLMEATQFHAATMKLLADLRDGNVLPEQIVITEGGWELKERDE